MKIIPIIKRALPYLALAILAGMLYDAYVFYDRWSGNRLAEQVRAGKEAEEAKKTYDALGGGQFKILNFYASPGAIRPGDHASICFGVSGAKTVRLEPNVQPLYPAVTHCFQVAPRKTTEYKLIAEDGKGHTAAESFVLQVVPGG